MNEAYCTSQIMGKMRQMGYLARKIAGGLHSANMPDFYASKQGVTVFFESKFFKVKTIDKFIRIPMTITPQMISMEEHALKARARYLLFVNDGDVTWLSSWEPHIVMGLIRGNGFIDPRQFFKGVNEWLRNDLPELYGSEHPTKTFSASPQ